MKLKVKNASGEIHEVRKYILDNEGVQQIWSNTWYGHHAIGKDCEWHIDDQDELWNIILSIIAVADTIKNTDPSDLTAITKWKQAIVAELKPKILLTTLY